MFLKQRRDYRPKNLCLRFPLFIFYVPVKHKFVYSDVKLYHQIDVFTLEYLNANNKLQKTFLSSQFTPFAIWKLQQINSKSFYCLLNILSVDLSLNTGQASNIKKNGTGYFQNKRFASNALKY